MGKYKMVVSDLDETLISMDRTICKRNIEAIQKAKELGVKFVPASGRGYTTIRVTTDELGLSNEPGEYIISFNGGAITENKEEKLLCFNGMPFEKVKEIFDRSLNYDVGIQIYTKDKVYGYKVNEDEWKYLNNRMEVIEFEDLSLDFLKDEPIAKILYQNTDMDYLHRIEKELKDIEDVETSFSSSRYLEFNPAGINKGSGLLYLADYLGIKPEEVIAIGDSYNDLAMIQAAGLGVGVANTDKDIIPLCDVITEADNDHGAVAEVIEKYILNDPENQK